MNRVVAFSARTLRGRHATAKKRSPSRLKHRGFRSHLSRCVGHVSSYWYIRGLTPRCRIRRCVTRESARLFRGFAPWGPIRRSRLHPPVYLTWGQLSLMTGIVSLVPPARPAAPGESLPAAGPAPAVLLYSCQFLL